MQGKIKATGEMKSLYPTRECGYDGYVDTDGKFYYPSEIDFKKHDFIKTPSGKTIKTKKEAIEYMISSLDKVIEGLQRNREILRKGGRLENENWSDIAGTFREAMDLFGNQDKFI